MADPDPSERPDPAPGRLRSAFGPLTAGRALTLAVAFAFLAGTVGWAIGERGASADPLSGTDVGFLQDMSYHHDQANRMSIILLDDPSIDPSLRSYAIEIIMDQRAQQGIMNATLDRYGHPTDPGRTAMGWMGHTPVDPDRMDGMASERQIQQLRKATGDAKEALFVALMSRHHLGGMEMADYEARHGRDRTSRNLARSMVTTQRGEVIDLSRFRTMRDLPIPSGFTDPLKDPRLNPATSTSPD